MNYFLEYLTQHWLHEDLKSVVCVQFPIGFSVAGNVRVGNAMGAGDVPQAKLSAKLSMISAGKILDSVYTNHYVMSVLICCLYISCGDVNITSYCKWFSLHANILYFQSLLQWFWQLSLVLQGMLLLISSQMTSELSSFSLKHLLLKYFSWLSLYFSHNFTSRQLQNELCSCSTLNMNFVHLRHFTIFVKKIGFRLTLVQMQTQVSYLQYTFY